MEKPIDRSQHARLALGQALLKCTPEQREEAVRIAAKLLAMKAAKRAQSAGAIERVVMAAQAGPDALADVDSMGDETGADASHPAGQRHADAG